MFRKSSKIGKADFEVIGTDKKNSGKNTVIATLLGLGRLCHALIVGNYHSCGVHMFK